MSVDRIGVNATAKIISQMGLIFRDQPTDDYGIDAQIETIDNNYASGKLIAVQIKSGESFFEEVKDGKIIFRGKKKHYEYWLNHSLPVIIVLYRPSDDKCYWREVNSDTAILTDTSWKIEIPISNTLDDAKIQLTRIADNLTEYERKFNSLLLAKPWMKEIISGNKVVLNVQEWVNKSSGRGEFNLKIIDKNGKERQVFDRSFFGFGYTPYEQVLKGLFPWARIIIDADFYEEYEDEIWDEWDHVEILEEYFENTICDCPKSADFARNYDSLNNMCPNTYSSMEEDMQNVENIRPYTEDGEVALYQLILELNDVGKAFLLLDEFIEGADFYKLDKGLLE